MNINVDVKFYPHYELLNSIHVFAHHRQFKHSELGLKWIKAVENEISSELQEKIHVEDFISKLRLIELLTLSTELSFECISDYLKWLEDLNEEEVCVHLSIKKEEIPSGFLTIVDVIKEWYKQYFQRIDQQIITDLAKDAETHRKAIPTENKLDFIEELTNGFRLEGFEEFTKIILIPHYHGRPINVFGHWDNVYMIWYPSSQALKDVEEPSPMLQQALKALNDKNRLKMLRYIGEETRSFGDLHKYSGLAKSTAHYHVVTLRASGLIRVHMSPNSSEKFSLRQTGFEWFNQNLMKYVNGQ